MLCEALDRVAAGGTAIDPGIVQRLMAPRPGHPLDGLSEREREVLSQMAEGRSNSGVAQVLSMSPRTVENHTKSIFIKLGLHDQPQDNRRVLAVLEWLRSTAQDPAPPHSDSDPRQSAAHPGPSAAGQAS